MPCLLPWRASIQYQPVQAQVLSATARQIYGGARTQNPFYRIPITYRYQVANRTFKSCRYAYQFDVFATAEEAKQTLKEYPIGALITAYYVPYDPSEAVLNPSPPRWVPAAVPALNLPCKKTPTAKTTLHHWMEITIYALLRKQQS